MSTTPVVIKLQEMASDGDTNILDLLRKAVLVATKLNLVDFKTWLLNELNGYQSSESLPDYRIIRGELRAQNPFHGLIPFIIEDAEIANMVCMAHLQESLASIINLVENSKKGFVTLSFPSEAEAVLMRLQGFAAMKPVRVIGKNQLAAVVHAVRTKVLEWALTLENEGILGEGMSFSENEKKLAQSSRSIRIENFQGVLGDIHGGTVNQSNRLTVTPGKFSSLSDYLKGQGVDSTDVKELEKAISSDPEIGKGKAFGGHVSSWIGRMMAKAADGSWEIGVAAAGGILASAIAKFYGIS